MSENAHHTPSAAEVLAPLIGTPWQRGATGPDAFDCWSFAALLQKTLKGRTLPLAPVLDLDTTDNRAVIHAIRTSPLQREWLPVDKPGHGDLVMMRRNSGASHCGVWIDEGNVHGIAHCARGAGVLIQSEAQVRVQYRGLDYRRPAAELPTRLSTALEPALKADFDESQALVVIVHDPEHPLVGADFIAVPAGLTPLEVLARHGEQITRPIERSWLFHNAEPLLNCHPETGEDEWLTRAIGAGEVLWVAPIPPAGGGDSNVFAAIAAIALTVVAPYLAAGLGGAFLTAAGTLSFAGQVLSAGIALGGNLLISALVGPSQAQSVDNLESASPTYTLSPPGNQLRPSGQIPWICGTVLRQPDLLTSPYGEFADNEQLFYTLLGIGLGKYQINEIGIGDTAVWTSADGLTGSLDDVEFEVLLPGERVTLFPSDVQTSVEVGGQVLTAPEEDENDLLVETVIGPFVAVASGTTANVIGCDFAFASGLFRLNDSGKIKSVTVRWRVEVRKIDDFGEALGDWQVFPSKTVSIGSTTPQRLTYDFPVIEGRYEVRAVRETESTLDEGRGQDELTWVGLKAYIPGDQTFEHVTAIAIKARATETSSQAQRTWYVDATRILPYWDGTDWVEGPTEAIEAAILEVATSEVGLEYAQTDIDLSELERLAETWSMRGDVCCLAIDTAMGVWEALEAVSFPGRTKPQLIANYLTFMRDEARAFPVQLITHADIVRGSLEITRNHYTREKPNAIVARYWDRTGTMREVECVPPGISEERWATVDMPGIVDRDQVFREGVTLAAANNLRRTSAGFTMLENGRSLRIGELIALSHPRPEYGKPSRVVSMDWPTLVLSEPHGAEDGDPLWLRLSTPDGGHWGPVVVSAEADEYTVTVDEDDFALVLAAHANLFYAADARLWIITEETLGAPDADSVEAIAGRQVEPTRAVIGPDGGGELFEGVVMGMRPRPDGSVEVLAARENAGVHTAETGIVPAAPAASGLSLASGAPVWVGAVAEIVNRAGDDIVEVAGPAVPGATRYIFDTSTDGEAWVRADDSASPVLEASVASDETLQVRFAAVGDMRGPWGFQTLDTSAPVYGLTAPTNLEAIEAPESAFRFRWDIDPDATGWYGVIKVDDAVERVFAVSAPYYDYSEALQIEDGGPWASVTLELQATRGTESSAVSTLTLGSLRPVSMAAPSIVGSPSTSSVSLTSTSSSDPTVRGYRFAVTLAGDDPESPLAFTDSDDTSATVSGLSPQTTYDAFVAPYDSVRTGLNWSPATTFTTPAP